VGVAGQNTLNFINIRARSYLNIKVKYL